MVFTIYEICDRISNIIYDRICDRIYNGICDDKKSNGF